MDGGTGCGCIMALTFGVLAATFLLPILLIVLVIAACVKVLAK